MEIDNILFPYADAFFMPNFDEERRTSLLRCCESTQEFTRRSLVNIFSLQMKTALAEANTSCVVNNAASSLFSLLGNKNFGSLVIDEAVDEILRFFANSLSFFLQHSSFSLGLVNTSRILLRSLTIFIKEKTWLMNENNVIFKVIRSKVRYLMALERKLPIDLMLKCGIIVATIDLSCGCLNSLLWLLKHSEATQSPAFIAISYGILIALPSQHLPNVIVDPGCNGDSHLLISTYSILDSCDRQIHDRRFLFTALKFLKMLSQKILQTNCLFTSEFYERVLLFLWHRCDHFIGPVRSLSQQCLKNFLLQMDDKVLRMARKIILGSDLSDKLCVFLYHNYAIFSDDLPAIDRYGRLIRNRIQQIDDASLLLVSKVYTMFMSGFFREETFEFWFDKWVIPPWQMNDDRVMIFQEKVVIAAITLTSQSLESLMRFASNKQVDLIVKSILLIEDEKVRSQRILLLDMQIISAVSSTNPLAVLACINVKKNVKECNQSLQKSVDCIFRSNNEFLQRIFIQRFKNVMIDREFKLWLRHICFLNLFAGASFGRRFLALQLLSTLSMPLVDCSYNELLMIFTCLGDTYQENQRAAVSLLTSVVNKCFNTEHLRSMYKFVFDAILEANVGEHESCAYICQLLCAMSDCRFDILFEYGRTVGMKSNSLSLNECDDSYFVHVTLFLQILQVQLLKFECIPLYGLLRVIRHLLECAPARSKWPKITPKIVRTCIECNLQVVSIVNESSPEGFLSLNESTISDMIDETNVYASSQKTLLRSWRTIKETSLLLTNLLDNELFSEALLVEVGAHLKSLLLNMKHKGAIGIVYVTACAFCRVCVKSKNESINSEPKCWLHDIIKLIINAEDNICRWRRGAGIPFIAQAVLSCDTPKFDYFCNQFVNRLLQLYGNQHTSIKSKIHAANVLRAVFKNRSTSHFCKMHAEETIMHAISGVASNNWDIRNVSWLLLGSVLRRIIKTENPPVDCIIFFRRFPSLFEFFLILLCEFNCPPTQNESSVMAVLLIFAAFEPLDSGANDDFTFDYLHKLKLFLPVFFEYGASSVWKIRETAARAILALLSRDSYTHFIISVCSNVSSTLTENSLHGILLQIDYVLQRWSIMPAADQNDLHQTFINFVEETNHILEDNKRSIIVKRQLLKVRILMSEKLTRWAVKDVDVATPFTDDHILRSSACSSFDHGDYIYDIVAYRVNCSLRAANNNLKDELEKNMLFHPEATTYVLEALLQPVTVCFESSGLTALLRNKIIALTPANRNHVVECVTNSQVICAYLDRIVRNTISHRDDVFRALRVLSCLVESPYFKSLTVDTIVRLCKITFDSEAASLTIVEYALATFKFQTAYSQNDRDQIFRSICKLNFSHFNESFHRKRIILYRDHMWRTRCIPLLLDMWTQTLEFALHEQNEPLDSLLHHFYINSSSWCESIVYAVAYTVWTIADVSSMWLNNESDSSIFAFDKNFPECLENYIILSRACSNCLFQLLRSHPFLRHAVLNVQLRQWLEDYCVLPTETTTRLQDVFSFLFEKYSSLASHFKDCNSYLRRDAVYERFMLNKIQLFIAAFKED